MCLDKEEACVDKSTERKSLVSEKYFNSRESGFYKYILTHYLLYVLV